MRAFGIELSPNVRSIAGKRKFLTPIERASIVTARVAGVSRQVLAAKFDCSLTAITYTVKRV
ncbi:hypothetical protein BT67DRAFT_437804 [Trichocladium antarcticum]|uniref:Uncharacterized protein n=1 Tax=Trichocladium antarcticum TaxID=1450529 RepID=A0AAN6UT76_9PEZI|nr:hypothetical protein BT67DRAFT_437804 [Trichocladium antarcticum]